MNVLVACEESQAVCKAFRAKGHNAFSCDLQKCSGGHPEWHILGNVQSVVTPTNFGNPYDIKSIYFVTEDFVLHDVPNWDLVIAHPPCTYLSRAGARYLFPHGVLDENRFQKGLAARDFFMFFYNLGVKHICIENPVPLSVFQLPKASQIIEPYFFGDSYRKRTYLWLKNLPPLISTDIVASPDIFISSHSGKGFAHGSVARSKIFSALQKQWQNNGGV